jgi:hypothetical protein
MKKSLQITTPCHENWDEMSATEQGKFCDSCAKTVIDFTNKSKAEIIDTIENSTGSVCGRYHEKQVDEIGNNGSRLLYPIAASLTGLALLAPGQTQAQDTTAADVELEPFVLLEPFVITESEHRYLMGISATRVKYVTITPHFVRNEDLGKKAELNPAGKLYPNPAQESTTLEMNDDSTYDIRVFDMNGKMVFNDKVIGTKQRINTSDYQPGMYFVNITPVGKEEMITLKLIVK